MRLGQKLPYRRLLLLFACAPRRFLRGDAPRIRCSFTPICLRERATALAERSTK